MSRKLLISLVFAIACGGTETTETPVVEPVPETPPVTSMDPVVVGPTVYSMVLENDQVRINNVSFDPGEEIGMHSHPDHILYAISGGKLDIAGADGKVNHVEITAGQSMYGAAESHTAKNVGDTVVEAALVELKAPTGAAAPAGTDPAVAGPSIYKMVFEDEHARVFETTFAPGAEIPMHTHPDHAVYVLAGGKIQITGADGKAQEMELAAGQAAFLPAQAHSAKNLGETELKLVVFEIKPMAAVAGP